MEYLDAVLLGIVQGIAEFLPVSSSGHIVIVSHLMQEWSGREFNPEENLQMNVAVHLGTLLSILWVYRADLIPALRNPRLCIGIVAATVPLVIVGLVGYDFIKDTLQTPVAAGIGLFVTAGLLMIAQRHDSGERVAEKLPLFGAIVVGLFQLVAIVPGISRSGSTISAGLFCKLRRQDAARFSFLIAIPAISGAVVLTAYKIYKAESSSSQLPVLAVGALISCVVGVFALSGLLRMVTNRRLHWFAWYCAIVGTATLIWQAAIHFGG